MVSSNPNKIKKCDCNIDDDKFKTLKFPYILACKYIKDNSIVVDVGCNDGRNINNLKDHLLTHDMKIKTIGIDDRETEHLFDFSRPDTLKYLGGLENAIKKAQANRDRLDEFILSPVAKVTDINALSDYILCFGFSCYPDERKGSYLKMIEFLKSDGKVILDVVTPNKMLFLRRLLALTRLFRYVHKKFQRKLMTKQEFILHVESCISEDFNSDGINCKHGKVLYDDMGNF